MYKSIVCFLCIHVFAAHASQFDLSFAPVQTRFKGGDVVTITWSILEYNTGSCKVTSSSPVEIYVYDADSFEYFDDPHQIVSAVDPLDPVDSITGLLAGDGQYAYTFPYNFKDCDCGADLYFKVRLRSKPECRSGRAALWEYDHSAAALAFGSNSALSVSTGGSISVSLQALNLVGVPVVVRLYETYTVAVDKYFPNAEIYINGQLGNSFTPSTPSQTVTIEWRPTLTWSLGESDYEDLYFYAFTNSQFNDADAESALFDYKFENLVVSVTEPDTSFTLKRGDDLQIRWEITNGEAAVSSDDTFEVYVYDLKFLDEVVAQKTVDGNKPKILDKQVVVKGSEFFEAFAVGSDMMQVKLVHANKPSLVYWSAKFDTAYADYTIELDHSVAPILLKGQTANIFLRTSGLVGGTVTARIEGKPGDVWADDILLSESGVTPVTLNVEASGDAESAGYWLPLFHNYGGSDVVTLIGPVMLLDKVDRVQCNVAGLVATCTGPNGAYIFEIPQEKAVKKLVVEWAGPQCTSAATRVHVRITYETVDGLSSTESQFADLENHVGKEVEFSANLLNMIWNLHTVEYPDVRNYLKLTPTLWEMKRSWYEWKLPEIIFTTEAPDCSDVGGIVTNAPFVSTPGTTERATTAPEVTTEPDVIVNTGTVSLVVSVTKENRKTTVPEQGGGTTMAQTSTQMGADQVDEGFVGSGAFYGVIVTVSVCCLLFIAVLVGVLVVCARRGGSNHDHEMSKPRRRTRGESRVRADSRVRSESRARAGTSRSRAESRVRAESRARAGTHERTASFY